ncbi:MAG: hypothetical protein AABX79_00900 [Nanoarchaeota archaeon]
MKKGVWILALLASLFLMNFASAQFFDGYGWSGSISLGDFFDSLDPTTVVYGLLFFIFFTVIFLILTKVNLFRGRRTSWGGEEPNTTAAGVVAFAISALIVYYMYRQDYNLESLIYGIGLSTDMFSFLLAVIFVIVAFVIIKQYGFAGLFIVLGLFAMFIAGFTDIIYEKTTSIFIGAVLFVIGISLTRSGRKFWKKDIRSD